MRGALLLAGGILPWAPTASAADDASVVTISASAPLPGVGIARDQVPGNVQAVDGTAMARQQASSLTDYLNQNLDSVTINAAQNNAYQSDVLFRGFTASPLLGTPQGLSVFVDGVRANEAFGDTVNWDLIPQAAIAAMALVPGSNPVYGLNTLGGALAVQMKSGRDFQGTDVTLGGGSYGRRGGGLETGGVRGAMDYYLAANADDDGGALAHSGSRIRQLFSRLGYQGEATDFAVTLMHADNRMEGAQSLPLAMLSDPRQTYSWPDTTGNRASLVNVRATRYLANDDRLSGNVYYRQLAGSTFNSNMNGNYDPGQGSVLADGSLNYPAANDLSRLDQRTFGGTLQYARSRALFGHKNQFVAGVSYDGGRADFAQYEQAATVTGDRQTVGASAFTQQTHVSGRNDYYGAYFSNVWSATGTLHLTASGRYNLARTVLGDETGAQPDLNADHAYRRFNPAAGLNYRFNPALESWLSYSEGMRVPSPVELTCSDPASPCRLPNAFVSDPALRPVIARTWETGLRGLLGRQGQWHVAAYRTELADDIQFIGAGGGNSAGYFSNVGDTRRLGLEAGMTQRLGNWRLSGSYSLVNATYESALALYSPNNSTSGADGTIRVRPGDRMPGVPRQMLKLRAEYAFTPSLSAGLNAQVAAAQYARGDENNQDANGMLPGYALLNADARYQWTPRLLLSGHVTNLLNRDYATFGQLGQNYFTGPGESYGAPAATQFRAVGAPRALWVNLRYALEKNRAGQSQAASARE